MSEITDYVICSDLSAIGLQKEVQEYIEDGWQPYGPMLVIPTGSATLGASQDCYQPMVKYSEPYKIPPH